MIKKIMCNFSSRNFFWFMTYISVNHFSFKLFTFYFWCFSDSAWQIIWLISILSSISTSRKLWCQAIWQLEAPFLFPRMLCETSKMKMDNRFLAAAIVLLALTQCSKYQYIMMNICPIILVTEEVIFQQTSWLWIKHLYERD